MILAVDVEAFDPNLKTKGDGALRSREGSADYDGSRLLMCAWFDGERGGVCYPNTESWAGLKNLLETRSLPKVFHNSVYDLSWLELGAGVRVRGDVHDTMTRASYIDEYQDLDLDSCCRAMGIEGKNKGETIEKWYRDNIETVRLTCAAYGRPFKRSDPMWKHTEFLLSNFPAFKEKMEEYNLQDAKATWELYRAQEPLMRPFHYAYMMDVRLMPMVLEMKRRGILVDRERMEELSAEVSKDYALAISELESMYGIDEETLDSPKKLGKRMNEMGVHSPVKTPTGAESWAVGALSRIRHPAVTLIQEARGYKKLLGTYLEGSLKESVMSDGRIHCTFTPNRRDDGGTVTGRFSCSKPNLQQIPARGKAVGHSYGQAMRSLFLPEEGCMTAALDYSQIEYLLLAHFAVGSQAEWLREQARAGVDFHDAAMKMTGIESRKAVKAFNYGVMYGMGWNTAMLSNWTLFDKLAREEGITIEQYTKNIYNRYHEKLPVIRDTSEYVQKKARKDGYVTTIGGRRLHTPKARLDPKTGESSDNLYKMLNKLIQGSAADIMKRGMLDAWERGAFDCPDDSYLCCPHLTVHDELVFSAKYCFDGMDMTSFVGSCMESAFEDELKVPMKVDKEVGPNWGYWESDIWREMHDEWKFTDERRKECWWGRGGRA